MEADPAKKAPPVPADSIVQSTKVGGSDVGETTIWIGDIASRLTKDGVPGLPTESALSSKSTALETKKIESVPAEKKATGNRRERPELNKKGAYRSTSPGLGPLGEKDDGTGLIDTLSKASERGETIKSPLEKKNFRIKKFADEDEWIYFLTNSGYRQMIVTTPAKKKNEHPWKRHIKSAHVLSLNGVPGDYISLGTKDRIAISLMKGAKCSVMITEDLEGGPKAKPIHPAAVISPGETLICRVDSDFPSICYYQSTTESFIGGALMTPDVEHNSDSESESEDDNSANSV